MSEESAPQIGLIGRTIAGKYAIESLLGVGAMGAVFKARHLGLEQAVAVKVMHSHFSTEPKFADRFRREAQATVRFDHPNSVRVFDFGEEPDGLLYLVMELLDGRDLARVIIEDWPLSTERVVGIVRQVVSALAAAHDAEIIHRDLKPENVMVLSRADDDGNAVDVCKVCDFGIAQLGDPRNSRLPPATTKLTSHGLIIGTPEYMSPEQGRGDPLDARADLYAVGVILYELITGQLPFQADNAIGVILKHASHPVVPPSEVRSSVHAGLEQICLRAMQKDAGARFQSAREMRAALNALSTEGFERPSSSVAPSKPLRAETETAMYVAAPPKKKRGSSRALAYVAVAIALVPIAAWSALRSAPPPAPGPTTAQEIRSAPIPEPSPSVVTPPPAESATEVANAEPRNVERAPVVLAKPVSPAPPLRRVAERAPSSEAAPPITASPAVVEPPPVVAAPPAVPVAPAHPSFDPSSGRVSIGAVSNEEGVLRRDVIAAVTRVARTMTSCYQDDLRSTMVPKSGLGSIHLETDGAGVVSHVRARVPFSPGVAACLERAMNGLRIAGVDTGDAAADVALDFDLR